MLYNPTTQQRVITAANGNEPAEKIHGIDAFIADQVAAGIGDKFAVSTTAPTDLRKVWVDKTTQPAVLKVNKNNAWGAANFSDVWLDHSVGTPITEFGEWGSDSTVNSNTLKAAVLDGGDIYVPAGEYPLAQTRATVRQSLRLRFHPLSKIIMDEIDGDGLQLVSETSNYTPERIIDLELYGLHLDYSAMMGSIVVPARGDYPPLKQGTEGSCDGLQILGQINTGTVLAPIYHVGFNRVIVEDCQIYAGEHWLYAGGDSGVYIQGAKFMKITRNIFTGCRDLGVYCRQIEGGAQDPATHIIEENTYNNCFFGASVKNGLSNVSINNERGNGTSCIFLALHLTESGSNISVNGITANGAWNVVRVDGFENVRIGDVDSYNHGVKFDPTDITEYNTRAALAGVPLISSSTKPLHHFTNNNCGVWLRGGDNCNVRGVAVKSVDPDWVNEVDGVVLESYTSTPDAVLFPSQKNRVARVDVVNDVRHAVREESGANAANEFTHLYKEGRLVCPNGLQDGSCHIATKRFARSPVPTSHNGTASASLGEYAFAVDEVQAGMTIKINVGGRIVGINANRFLGISLGGTDIDFPAIPAAQNGDFAIEIMIESYNIDGQRIHGRISTEKGQAFGMYQTVGVDMSVGQTVAVTGRVTDTSDTITVNWFSIDAEYGEPWT